MQHFWTKALWHLEIIMGNNGTRQLAKSLEKIFEMLWIKLSVVTNLASIRFLRQEDDIGRVY